MAQLERARAGSDHRAVKDAIAALNRATDRFAARRMDRAISSALSGRKVDEVSR
jgi:molecular chaperone HscA